MLRKIRRFYWKQRDRGLGRQIVMAAVGAALFLMIILGAVTKNVIMPKNESQKNVARTETASGTAIGAEPASGGGVAIENIETGIESEGEKTDSTADDSNNDVSVDMTDLEPFLGFMSETAYEELKTQLVQICQERNCSSVRKLTYQQTQAFDVASFILLPDGSVYQCNYNLKSCQVSVSKTDYTEVQINQMKEKQLQEEQQKLEQEQKAEKQKLQKKKVEKKKTIKKKKAKKKPVKKKVKKKRTQK